MEEGQKLTLINETDDHYEVENEDGKIVKMFKIKKDDIDKWHNEAIQKVADAFDDVRIKQIIKWLENILNNIPTVETYLDVVTELSVFLEECYNVVGRPNLFHFPIKNINPKIYGRADGLMEQVVQLHNDMLEVADVMVKMGKLNSVKTTNINKCKYTIYVHAENDIANGALFEATEAWILRYTLNKHNYEVNTEFD